MRRTLAVPAIVGAAALALLSVPAHAQSSDPAMLSVLHGVPDTPVDVYVDGELTLDDFAPGDLAGPLELPAGTYSVAITASDAEDDSEPVIGPVDLELSGGGNYTAVAFLDEAGSPTAALFMNDTSDIAAGEGRLTVRHVAAAPEVDILAGGEAVISGLANGAEESLDLPAGTVSASVAAAGTTEPVLGPADVPVTEGTLTIVYAWGSLEDDTLAVATQTVEGMHSAPGGVPTGQVEVQTGLPAGLWVMMVAAGLGMAVLLGSRSRRDDTDREGVH